MNCGRNISARWKLWVRAYAANNPQEYFAELSEAWFGANDFYPFVRAEVLEHDPEAAELLKKLWGE